MSNLIGENMLTRTNADEHLTMVLQGTFNHRTDETAHELKDNHDHVNY